jgi:hypothetical protein
MPDLQRLHAEAEQAQIRGEMARSQLLIAKASARARSLRWSEAHSRRLNAARSTGAILQSPGGLLRAATQGQLRDP